MTKIKLWTANRLVGSQYRNNEYDNRNTNNNRIRCIIHDLKPGRIAQTPGKKIKYFLTGI